MLWLQRLLPAAAHLGRKKTRPLGRVIEAETSWNPATSCLGTKQRRNAMAEAMDEDE